MSYAPIPSALHELLRELTTSIEHSVYAQVATVTAANTPAVRTVHIRYIDERASIGFATNVHSAKWAQLQQRPSLAGSYYDPERNVQLRWEGDVECLTAAQPAAVSIRTRLWRLMRPEVRCAYWRDTPSRPSETQQLESPSPDFAVVCCRPQRWELYRVSPLGYDKDTREIFTLQPDLSWQRQAVIPLHGRPLTS